MTDPIADMLTRLRNAAAARHTVVRVPRSLSKERLGSILLDEGFVEEMNVIEKDHLSWIEFKLKYLDGVPTFRGAKRVSRPGLRVYSRSREIPRVMGGIGTAVLSTSQGVMTGPEAAKRRLGGEVLCFVW
ncbi:MAG TPA: 30S ribosomal protein S8 [Chloroflexi bacterium]|nr:30S ribosomal protein S8 [Chloroflexota bacterium]|tara:strand:+ start:3075 stop:3464 length:390 start_codon:yes stop_codon:yes gene_type:complete